MKKYLIILFANFAFVTYAQEPSMVIDQKILDALIFSAMENSHELDKQAIRLKANEYEKKMTKTEHLGLVAISANLNEFSIKQLSGDNSIPNFYPRYNIGFNLRLNHFSNVKGKKKLLDNQKELFLAESKEVNRDLVEEVTKKYIEFVKRKNELNIIKKLEQFSLFDFNANEAKYVEGIIELDEYKVSRDNYYKDRMNVINSESAFLTIKTEIESLIGNKLSGFGID